MTVEHSGPSIRRIEQEDAAAIEAYLRIRNEVTPESADSIEQVGWEAVTYPGEVARFLAEMPDGTAVGTASTGRIWMHERDYERYWLGIWVLPEARNAGIGSALFAAAGDAARAAGKTGFQTYVSEARPEGIRFLAGRGFVITDRDKAVRLDLPGMLAPDVRPPAGFAVVTLAGRPDLLSGVYATACEAFPDIPSDDRPVDPHGFDEFVARDVDRPGIPHDAFFVAVDEATDQAVGYASLRFKPGSTTVVYHDMTAVRRAFRGRGIARALKRATIAWGITHGLEALETGNDERNAPMRAVNIALGYQPLPDWLGMQGPLPSPR